MQQGWRALWQRQVQMNSGALKVEALALKRGVHETHGPHQREQSGLDMDAINGIDFLNPVQSC
jgi:hypothetical protein